MGRLNAEAAKRAQAEMQQRGGGEDSVAETVVKEVASKVFVRTSIAGNSESVMKLWDGFDKVSAGRDRKKRELLKQQIEQAQKEEAEHEKEETRARKLEIRL